MLLLAKLAAGDAEKLEAPSCMKLAVHTPTSGRHPSNRNLQWRPAWRCGCWCAAAGRPGSVGPQQQRRMAAVSAHAWGPKHLRWRECGCRALPKPLASQWKS